MRAQRLDRCTAEMTGAPRHRSVNVAMRAAHGSGDARIAVAGARYVRQECSVTRRSRRRFMGIGMEKRMLAADFGASSARVMLGTYDGSRLNIRQLHRFLNEPVQLGSTMYWDFLRLFLELKNGMKMAAAEGVDSISVDTWGVDFGLLDQNGELLGNPVHYRDSRTNGILEEAYLKISKERLYEITGNQLMEINTAFQLLAMQKQQKEMLESAGNLLMMPDLFQYFLSGEKFWEYTAASTTQLLDVRNKVWSAEVLDRLGISGKLFGTVGNTGTRIGTLRNEVCAETGLGKIAVIAGAGHDTQCALAAVPAKGEFVFVSCGTWSLVGTQLDKPIVNAQSKKFNLTNEGAYGGKISFLKNIIGLWLVQESRRQWSRDGQEYDFGQLDKMAEVEESQRSFVDPDDPVFVPAGDIPWRICNWCQQTGQAVPETPGQIVRCIHESLAMKYRMALEEISACTKKKYDALYLVGGGSQSRLLCQTVANVCRIPVYTGPVEATVYGNLAIQLAVVGEISGQEQMRSLVAASKKTEVYEPAQEDSWEDAYARFREIYRKKQEMEK